jgi:hypothetical protein
MEVALLAVMNRSIFSSFCAFENLFMGNEISGEGYVINLKLRM